MYIFCIYDIWNLDLYFDLSIFETLKKDSSSERLASVKKIPTSGDFIEMEDLYGFITCMQIFFPNEEYFWPSFRQFLLTL